MKGAVFISLQEMVEQSIGFAGWQQLIDACNLPSQGAYTSGGKYDDSEMAELVGMLSERLATPIPDLLKAFGNHLFKDLAKGHGDLLASCPDGKSFLLIVDQQIHVDIEKLYANSSLPFLDVVDTGPNKLHLTYRSPRKLCYLAEGLIHGVAEYYHSHVTLEHGLCMHEGHTCCAMELSFEPK